MDAHLARIMYRSMQFDLRAALLDEYSRTMLTPVMNAITIPALPADVAGKVKKPMSQQRHCQRIRKL